MDKKNIIVTGGAGFIGSNLTDALIEQGHRIIVIDNLSTGKKENLNPKAEFHCLDIRDFEKIKPLFNGIDYVFHLAALPRIQPSIQDPILFHSINLTGTLNVLVCARDAGVKKVIYSASSSAYGDQETLPLVETMPARPKNPYAVHKHVGELYCKIFSSLYNLPTVCLRYFNVYGPKQAIDGAYATVIGIFLRQKANGEPLPVVEDGGIKRRDFTFVNDVVRANLLAMESDKAGQGEVINIGTSKNYSVDEVADLVLEYTKNYPKYSVQSASASANQPIVRIPARPAESLATLADVNKAKELLGWVPEIDLYEGLKRTIQYDSNLP